MKPFTKILANHASNTPTEHLKKKDCQGSSKSNISTRCPLLTHGRWIKSALFHPAAVADIRVKYATQVFSESVSVALLTLIAIQELPLDAKFTALFTERMDKIFDSLNSSTLKNQDDKLRYAMIDGSEHRASLESCISWIAQWHFGSPRDKQPCTVKGWQITIKALLLLWTDLKEDFDFTHLFTR